MTWYHCPDSLEPRLPQQQNTDEDLQVHRGYLCGDQRAPHGSLGRHWRSSAVVTETNGERSEEHLELNTSAPRLLRTHV